MVDVAQSVRVTDCGSEGRGFESHLPPEVWKPCDSKAFFVVHRRGNLFTNGNVQQKNSDADTFKLRKCPRGERKGKTSVAKSIPSSTRTTKQGDVENSTSFCFCSTAIHKFICGAEEKDEAKPIPSLTSHSAHLRLFYHSHRFGNLSLKF